MKRATLCLMSAGVLLTIAASPASAANQSAITKSRFLQERPQTGLYETDGRITQVFGRAFSHGTSPEQSARTFLDEYASMFGVPPQELVPEGPGGLHQLPIMYNAETDSYKFTGLYYTQQRDGVPVFRSRLTLLVRNEAEYPLVLASANLHDLGDFDPSTGPRLLNAGRGVANALKFAPTLIEFTQPELVIWAGVDGWPAGQPVLAHAFSGDSVQPVANGEPDKFLFVTDAASGAILYQEDMILHTDVEGNVSGRATEGAKADICADEVPTPMKWARVSIGGTVAYTDENGDFVIPNAGSDPVDVTSVLRGQWFRVYNQATGGDATITLFDVVPPGPADFMHNDPNTEEYVRAQVNGYYHANVVRDFVIKYNPAYPGLQQSEFPVNVNLNDTCNAYYDYSSINFFRAGGGCVNSAFSTVVHHEYGHHLVAMAGSGQGQYGEGMSDTMGVMIMDDPYLAWGFYSDCNDWMRSADNTMQYPCDGAIHYCGQLLSGCVWDLRNELIILYPETFIDVLAPLAVNAILLHNGDMITPQITIDFLTLDDDDANIYNGTPHYVQIDTAFSAHNMDAPELDLIDFQYPDGRPTMVDPNQATTFAVNVVEVTGVAVPGTGQLHYSLDGGAFVTVDMTENAPNEYEATLPAAECFSNFRWYVSAEAEGWGVVTDPPDAPDVAFDTIVATGIEVQFDDNFEDDLGWTVENYNLDTGAWERAVPQGSNGTRGDPPTDYDGSGKCFVTGNAWDEDIDGGPTRLISPTIDLSGASEANVSYARWFYNDDNDADRLLCEVSNDNGASWITMENVSHKDGWEVVAFRVGDFVTPNDQVRFRFSADDNPNDSVTEAAIDAFTISMYLCESTCPEDVNDDDMVDIDDVFAVLAHWGEGAGTYDVNDDGMVDIDDVFAVLSAWGPCE
ncbi:MAG: hypothetical protein JSV91_14950 [Phycisphaerales bacterium]|nr:MAG: hypothetical protein JSV91_14950 [Phycisphaerales bacterium]